jgi:hypothetical protein
MRARGMTYAEVGRRVGLSRERVRQICGRHNGTWKSASRSRRVKEALLSIKGERKTLKEWAALSEVGVTTIRWRLQLGMTPEKAVLTPRFKNDSTRRGGYRAWVARRPEHNSNTDGWKN